MESFEYSRLKKPKDIKMKVFFLGAYSDKGREGMMASSYDARVKAVSAMVERAGAKLGSVDYLQGPFDVIADAEVD